MPLPASLHELHVLKSLSNSSLPRAVRTKGPKHTGPCCDLAIRRQRQEQQPPTTGTSRAACLPTNPVPVLKHCPLASPTAAPCAAALTACRGSQPAAEGLLSGQSGHKPPPPKPATRGAVRRNSEGGTSCRRKTTSRKELPSLAAPRHASPGRAAGGAAGVAGGSGGSGWPRTATGRESLPPSPAPGPANSVPVLLTHRLQSPPGWAMGPVSERPPAACFLQV